MIIKINNQEYRIKQTIRALFLFEEITGRSFEIKTTLDNYLYLYCLLLANNENFMEWNDFINEMDNDPAILVEFAKFLNGQQQMDKLLNGDDESTDDNKKKE